MKINRRQDSLKLADYYMQVGLFSEAALAYKEVLRTQPMSDSIYLSLGEALYKAGKKSQALDTLHRGALICLRHGKLTKAQRMLDKMFAIDKTARNSILLYQELHELSHLRKTLDSESKNRSDS